ncbi:hypothetical protein JXC34_02090 [Candidatus Woesearchaeota archaeon]|nr:hypothetical protein [Candidatus Woesearchaeota archaeon]
MIRKKTPLKKMVQVTRKKSSGRVSHEDSVFSMILAVFIFGVVIFGQLDFSGRAISQENQDTLVLDLSYNSSASLNLTLQGYISSIRLSGRFIGNGSGRILLDDLVVVDKDNLLGKTGLGITGMVAAMNESEEPVEIVETEENESVEETVQLIENDTTDINDTDDIAADELSESKTLINSTGQNESLAIEEEPGPVNESIREEIVVEIEEVEENETMAEAEVEQTIEFSNICVDTCFLSMYNPEITLVIELEGSMLELSSITYTYREPEEIVEEIPILEENLTLANATTNISENVTSELVNLTNITINITTELNLSRNISVNQSLNLSLNITANISAVNLTRNITLPSIMSFEDFNKALLGKDLLILEHAFRNGRYNISLGLDAKNLVQFSEVNLYEIDVDFVDLGGEIPISKTFVLGNNLSNGSAEIRLEAEYADVVLECVQYEDNSCKRWRKTNLLLDKKNSSYAFSVAEAGEYVLGILDTGYPEYIAASSVFLNKICPGCQISADCNAEKFCPVSDQGSVLFSYMAQLGFDIYELDGSAIDFAEICSYTYSRFSQGPVENYVRDSELSYCSDLREHNLTSLFVSSATVDQASGWVCIPVTELLQHNLDQGYSDMFLDWMGQDLDTGVGPYNCYLGSADLEECAFNPSGAEDCRPYLRIEYKS